MIMKESMMKNQVFVSIPMNKIYATCIISAVAWCAAAQACSPRLDGEPTYCPDELILPREELRGDLDVLNVEQWNDIHHMFLRNQRREQIEQNMTLPVDALNSALEDYWKENGSNDTTEQKELL